MGEKDTTWTNATKNPSEAMMGLVSCLETGRNAWIEVMENGSQEHPIKIKNPLLDNPFNWTMCYGRPRNENELAEHDYFNEVEKDLTYNWTTAFGTKEAIEAYQKDGTVSKELFEGGIIHPVKIEDADAYRRDIVKDNYKHGYWVVYWRPKDGISYYIVDDSAGGVFTVCHNNEPVDKKEALIRAAQFLLAYAEKAAG